MNRKIIQMDLRSSKWNRQRVVECSKIWMRVLFLVMKGKGRSSLMHFKFKRKHSRMPNFGPTETKHPVSPMRVVCNLCPGCSSWLFVSMGEIRVIFCRRKVWEFIYSRVRWLTKYGIYLPKLSGWWNCAGQLRKALQISVCIHESCLAVKASMFPIQTLDIDHITHQLKNFQEPLRR